MVVFSRRGLHGRVVDTLGRRIVRGDLPPGAVVDLELLEADLAVSRTVVREAVKVLTTKGLLDSRPRLGTFVRDRRDWSLLDADVMSWRDNGQPDARLSSEADVSAMREALDRMRASGRDVEAHVAADLAFHRAVLGASQNELLERLEVVLEPALRARDALTFAHGHDDAFLSAHAAVADAVADGDPDRAEAAMAARLDAAAADAAAILERHNP